MQPKVVQKVWGREEIFANNEQYCGKFLIIDPNKQCSLHYHNIKHETFVCLVGDVVVEYLPTYPALGQIERTRLTAETRQPFEVRPGMPHRFWSADPYEGAILIEVSSHHDDEDVVRLAESGSLSGSLI